MTDGERAFRILDAPSLFAPVEDDDDDDESEQDLLMGKAFGSLEDFEMDGNLQGKCVPSPQIMNVTQYRVEARLGKTL